MRTRGIVWHGKLYEFTEKSVIIDNKIGITTKRDLFALLDEVVKELGKDKFPNIDPMYFHIHSNMESPSFYVVSGHIYTLLKETTPEYHLHQQAKELLRPLKLQCEVVAVVNHERVLHVLCEDIAVQEYINEILRKNKDSVNVEIHISKTLPF